MAGFSSRLRERIESTRSNTSSLPPHQTKNIRGLTRLGGVGAATSPSGGLLNGRSSNSISTPTHTFISRKDEERPLSIVHRGTAYGSRNSRAAAGTNSNAPAPLGKSKIVPGWGACHSNNSTAPSGHLGGIKSRDSSSHKDMKHPCGVSLGSPIRRPSASGKHVPWAMHKPTSPFTLSQLSMSKPRWGDEEDDDDVSGGGTPASDKEEKGENNSRIDSCEHNPVEGASEGRQEGGDHHRNGGYSGWMEKSDRSSTRTSRNIDHCCPAVRQSDDARTAKYEDYFSTGSLIHRQTGYQAKNSGGTNYYWDRGNIINSRRGYNDWGHMDYRGEKRGKPRRGLFERSQPFSIQGSHRGAQSSQSSGRLNCSGDFFHSRGLDVLCTSGIPSSHHNNTETTGIGGKTNNTVSGRGEPMKLDPEALNYMESPGQSNNVKHCPYVDSLKSDRRPSRVNAPKEASCHLIEEYIAEGGITSPSSLLTDGHSSQALTNESSHKASPTVSPLVKLNSLGDGRSTPVTSSKPLSLHEETRKPISCPGIVTKESIARMGSATKNAQLQSSDPLNQAPPLVKDIPPKLKEKNDFELLQQQNVLRQVAQRRATVESRKFGYIQKRNGSGWGMAKKITLKKDSLIEGSQAKDMARHSNDLVSLDSCHLYERPPGNSPMRQTYAKEVPDCKRQTKNRKSQDTSLILPVKKAKSPHTRPNPCRIEGHDHDWTSCPNNPKSNSFIRNNPCRIEGHNHDWSDCVDNPKSSNYVRPIRKGKRVKPSPSDVAGKRTHGSIEIVSLLPSEDSSDHAELSLECRNCVPRTGSQDGISEEGSMVQAHSTSVHTTDPEMNEKEKTPEAKPFIPAPLPVVSAWMSGPPPVITKSLPPTPTFKSLDKNDSCQKLVLESGITNIDDDTLLTGHQENSFFPGNEKGVKKSTLPHGTSFLGNHALFGRDSLDCSTDYKRWNPPPKCVPRCFDPWKLNPFAPSTASALSVAVQSIWIDSAHSHVTPADYDNALEEDITGKTTLTNNHLQ